PVSGVSQPVTLTNTGNATLIFSQAASLGGNDAGDFSISGSTCVSGLAPGDSCGFNVNFGPTTAGNKSAPLSGAGDVFRSPQESPLGGTALAPPPPAETLPPLTPGGSVPQETGSPDIKVNSATFLGNAPAVGKPTLLDIQATNTEAQITGVIVDFGET